MGPLEVLWAIVVIFFLFIAFARGYGNELGVTTLIFVALFIITEFAQDYLPRIMTAVLQRTGGVIDDRASDHLLSTLLSVIFISILFASYAGATFTLPGISNRRNNLLNVLVGLLNGYLVAGTLWYFQDYYRYPVADFTNSAGEPLLLDLPLTPLAENLANFLPPYVVPPLFWAAMVMLLLLFRVRR
ncbi:MAG: hypothetical protein HUU23_17790 [Caldilineales bacterium]|nr:hypothetical protein [Caldilineales bacterium]